ncbi:hypothetical protein BDZ45DRAFT_739330 [Acephala macrosclerotiorum]|nr:hypothetical protein BDZ45DRAFT_739330 [Acephala macrosclerotiorum]
MARPMQSIVPEEQNLYHIESTTNNPRYTEPQQVYGPRQYIPDMSSWPEPLSHINDQHLSTQTTTSFEDRSLDAQYHFEQEDPSLWQYNEEHLHLEDTSISVHRSPETIMIDPRLRSPRPQHNINRDMIPHPDTDLYQEQYREQTTPTPSRQPYTQIFVVPISDRGDDPESFPNSNGLFCDFPSIVFRSFLPEGAISPVSTSRNGSGFLEPKHPIQGRPVVMHGPTQPQVYKPFRTRGSMGSDSSANSTSYASSMSRFTTPDIS